MKYIVFQSTACVSLQAESQSLNRILPHILIQVAPLGKNEGEHFIGFWSKKMTENWTAHHAKVALCLFYHRPMEKKSVVYY